MTEKPRDCWDKLEIVAKVALPLAIALVGFFLNSGLKERELRAQYVSLAIDLLQHPDTTAEGAALQQWAAAVVEDMAPVKMPPGLMARIQQRGSHLYFGSLGGGSEWVTVRLDSRPPRALHVIVDGEVRGTSPGAVELLSGEHHFEWREESGRTVCEGSRYVRLSVTLICDGGVIVAGTDEL